MNNFIIKNFFKKTAVKVIFTGEDKRIKIIWTIPKNNHITVGNHAWEIIPEKTFIHAGIPTIFVNSRTAEPLDTLDLTKVVMKSNNFEKIVNQSVASDMFDSVKKHNGEQLMIIIGIGMLIAVGYVIFKFNGLEQIITDFINSQAAGGAV